MIGKLKRWVRRDGSGANTGVDAVQPDEDALRVLMVCMGNICRSPLAEGVLRSKLASAGLQRRAVVDSAGTSALHANEPPDPRGQRQAAARGYEIAFLRARGVTEADFHRHDLLLAMDEQNLLWLRQQAPAGARAEMALLLDHATRHPGVREVPDPYYGSAEGFERVLDLIEDACDGLVAKRLVRQS